MQKKINLNFSKKILKSKIIILLKKKLSNKNKIIPLETEKNLGTIRHFPSANKE